jgi:RNA polymerase sigma-70 factor (ECF subfamily)
MYGAAVYRVLRRHGVPDRLCDDGSQRVFIVFSRRQNDVEIGKECAFLCATAVRVASDVRRLASERHEFPMDDPPHAINARSPEVDLQAAQGLRWLDGALAALDEDARAVFVLHELEEIPTPEIATALQIPVGTVNTRLRRARIHLREAYRALEEASP